jgi:hypothetical protein
MGDWSGRKLKPAPPTARLLVGKKVSEMLLEDRAYHGSKQS